MMIKVKTKEDLELLRSCPEVSPAYHELVEQYFQQLLESLCPFGLDPYLYSLEKDGYIVVLESRDDPHRLEEVGLPDGIAQSCYGPEWSEYHELADGTKVYQIAYLMSNEFVMTYYMDAALWPDDPIIQRFLQDQWADETKECDF